MECIVRCDLDKRFPQEVQLLQTVWDDCLQVIFSSFGKRSNPFADFWAIYAPHCRLAMDEADALTAAGCEEQSPEKFPPRALAVPRRGPEGRGGVAEAIDDRRPGRHQAAHHAEEDERCRPESEGGDGPPPGPRLATREEAGACRVPPRAREVHGGICAGGNVAADKPNMT
eukprot:6392817-Pyramimonas_sp.AAC.1